MGFKPRFDYKHIVYYDGKNSSIVDKTNQENIEWEKIKIGDKFIMIHPQKIGFSATYHWHHAFKITGYVDGFLKLSGYDFAGSFRLSDEENEKITIDANDENSFEVGSSWDSSMNLMFNTSLLAEHLPFLTFDNIGEIIDPGNERFDVCIKIKKEHNIDNKQYVVLNSTKQEILKILENRGISGDFERKVVAYLIENFKVNKLEYPLKKLKHPLLTGQYNEKNFSFFWASDDHEDYFNRQKEEEWEDETFEEWELDFDLTNKFFAL